MKPMFQPQPLQSTQRISEFNPGNSLPHLIKQITFLKSKLPETHFFFPAVLQPNACHGLLILEVSRSHTTHHSRYDSSGQVISSSQRPLPYNTQHSQQRNIHAPGRIRTHNLGRREAADLHLRPCGHWDRHQKHIKT